MADTQFESLEQDLASAVGARHDSALMDRLGLVENPDGTRSRIEQPDFQTSIPDDIQEVSGTDMQTGGFEPMRQSGAVDAVPDTKPPATSLYNELFTGMGLPDPLNLPGMAVARGALKGTKNFLNVGQDVLGGGAIALGDEELGEKLENGDLRLGDIIPQIPKGDGDGVVNPMLEGFTQFGVNLMFTSKIPGVKKSRIMRGLFADYAAFGAEDPNLNNILRDHMGVDNAVVDFLAKDKTSSNAMNRLKDSLEGVVVGPVALSVFNRIKQLGQKLRGGINKRRTYKQRKMEELVNVFPGDEKTIVDIQRSGKKVRPDIPTNKPKYLLNLDVIDTMHDVKRTRKYLRKVFQSKIVEEARDVRTRKDVKAGAEKIIASKKGKGLRETLAVEAETASRIEQRLTQEVANDVAEQLYGLSKMFLDGRVTRKEAEARLVLSSMLSAKDQSVGAASSRKLSDRQLEVGEIPEGSYLLRKNIETKVDELQDTLSIRDQLDNFKKGTPLANMSDDEFGQFMHTISNLDSPAMLRQYATDNMGPSFLKMLRAVQANSLLWSVATQSTNFASNILTNTMEFTIEKPLGALSSKLTGNVADPVRMDEMRAAYFGFLQNLKASWHMGKDSFKARERLDAPSKIRSKGKTQQAEKLEDVETQSQTLSVDNFNRFLRRNQRSAFGKHVDPIALNEAGWAASVLDGIFALQQLPGRFIMASDSGFKQLAYLQQRNVLAHIEGSNSGLKGDELEKFIIERAKKVDGKSSVEAASMAEYLTFTHKLGPKGDKLQALLNEVEVSRLIVPFLNTPLNLNKYAFERMPGLHMLVKEARENWRKQGRAGDTARARLAIGSGVGLTAMVMAGNGTVTGSGPVGPDAKQVRDLYHSVGWQEDSIIVKDDQGKFHYYSYDRADPLGMIFGATADLRILSKSMPFEEHNELMTAFTLSLSRQLISKTWATNLRRAFDAILAPEKNNKKYWNDLFTTVIPRISQQMGDINDRSFKETLTLIDEAKRKFGLKGDLVTEMDWLGEAKRMESPVFNVLMPSRHSVAKTDFVRNEMFQQGLALSTQGDILQSPDHKASIRLTPKQKNRLRKIIGKEVERRHGNLSEALEHTLKKPNFKKKLSGETRPVRDVAGSRKDKLQAVYNAYRERGVRQFLEEHPEIQSRLEEAELEQFENAIRSRTLAPSGATFGSQ
jgi:hypothetical protein